MNDLIQNIGRALRSVYDPDLKKDLISLGMIDHLVVQDQTISFTLILTTPACPLQELLKENCIRAIREQVSTAFTIVITTTAKVSSNRSKAPILPGVKNIIAIASGKGGVGKSTIATHLALALATHGARVGLLDADIFGPSIPTMWRCATEKPAVVKREGKQYLQPIERHKVKLLSIGFLAQEAVVWRGPMASAALKQLIQEVDWGTLDYLLVDLPPGTSDIHLTLVQTLSVTGTVIVTTPQKIALIDAIKAITMFAKAQIRVPILGLIENMAYWKEEATAEPHYIFGKEGGKQLAIQRDIPFLGQIPLCSTIAAQGDEGMPLTTPLFNAISQRVAQQIAIQNFNQNPIIAPSKHNGA